MEHGAWSMEHGAWSMEHGAWSMEHGERRNNLSGIASDIVTRYPAAMGTVAASAHCWSPVLAGAKLAQLE